MLQVQYYKTKLVSTQYLGILILEELFKSFALTCQFF